MVYDKHETFILNPNTQLVQLLASLMSMGFENFVNIFPVYMKL